MVRHYGPDRVPLRTIQRIVSTVRRAPSAGYSQGQRLLVVTEEAGRAEVARITAGWTAAEGREPWLESAPVLVLVCTREDDYHERYRKPDKLAEGEEIDWPVPYWFVDAGAAMMALLMAAIDEGLASGFLGVPVEREAELRAMLGIPGDVAIVGIATFGRAAPDPQWSASTSRATQPRRRTTEVFHWERWQGRRAG